MPKTWYKIPLRLEFMKKIIVPNPERWIGADLLRAIAILLYKRAKWSAVEREDLEP